MPLINPFFGEIDELEALRRDLVLAGLAPEDGQGVASLRCGERMAFSKGDSLTLSAGGAELAAHSPEALLHASVYAASPSAACVVIARSERLHGMLLAGRAPASDAMAPWGSQALAQSLAKLVEAHPADGVIALRGHGSAILIYAPGIEHLRDLIAMLAQGYIPV